MEGSLKCWRCGESLNKLTLPLGRQDECPACGNYVHVCRMCGHYDPAVTKSCREDDAEEVKEKARPNFCDYFSPSAHAFDGREASAEGQARQSLDALFGGAGADSAGPAEAQNNPLSDAEKLFGKKD